MNLFKKLFSQKHSSKEIEPVTTLVSPDNMSLDDAFVHNFISKGGKFLYCAHQEEVNQNLLNILNENHWENVVCLNDDLKKIITIVGVDHTNITNKDYPFFTFCEHLLAEDGSIMFSSIQVHERKIVDLPDHFIVFAKTSQLVKNKSEGLMGIRKNYQKNFPTNISSIKSYVPERVEEDFLNFGNNNAKNLYLLLLEDL
ncbi:MAG: LUD domain-containing protein [Aureibaculum sp.]